MDELIRLILDFLNSDDGPSLFDEDGNPFGSSENLDVAQQIAEAIVAKGWPTRG